MLAIAIGLAVILVVFAVPVLRRAALSLLGLLGIITAGSAVIAAVTWTLYASKPWLIDHKPVVVEEVPIPTKKDRDRIEIAERDLAAALADEEEQHLVDEQRRLEEEKQRTEILAARVRVILEEDRKLAEQAASYPLPAGMGERLGDIMAIRIPAWRDKDVAAAQKKSIRAWLKSMGLRAEETAAIVTAKAWGSLYDLWLAENPDSAPPSKPQIGALEVATGPSEEEPTTREDSFPEIEPFSRTEVKQKPREFTTQIRRRRPPNRPAQPRRIEAPRRSAPSRRPYQPPEVGPFGY